MNFRFINDSDAFNPPSVYSYYDLSIHALIVRGPDQRFQDSRADIRGDIHEMVKL
jgi:hypothetical protein